MVRKAWVMKLKPGNEALYKQRHDEIWPEMLDLMRTGQASTFTIFRYGLLLFAYQELELSATGAPVPDIVWKWWESMAPLMETNPDFSPVMEPVEEMFHFEKVA